MTGERWSKIEIAAYHDGELAPEDAARVARVIEENPEAAAWLEALRRSDALLREAFAAPAQEYAPAAMAEAIDAATGRVFRFRRRKRGGGWEPAALAASIALVVGLGVGATLFAPAAPERPALDVGPTGAAVAAALETAPSGAAEAGVRPLASFEVGDGVCREFETTSADATGIACRESGGWRVVGLFDRAPERPAGAEGYAPAAGAGPDAASILLDTFGAGPALGPAEEADRIARGWR